jgi:hypothetical protein
MSTPETTPATESNPFTNPRSPALLWFVQFTYGYQSEATVQARYGRGLTFQGSGLARFGQIAGWLAGLDHAGGRDIANKFAEDFDRVLKYALAGCEEEDTPVLAPADGKALGSARAFRRKLVLADDGTFGGFSCAWYQRVTSHDKVMKAREIDPAAWASEDGLAKEWDGALEAADKHFRIDAKLDDRRYYRPVRETGFAEHMASTIVHYGYTGNGGLLYHGPGGGEVFAVTLGDVRGWSLHT